jgi:hypothetical protein
MKKIGNSILDIMQDEWQSATELAEIIEVDCEVVRVALNYLVDTGEVVARKVKSGTYYHAS